MSRKLASASWSPSCFSKALGGLESHTAWNFILNYPPAPWLVHKQFGHGSIPPGTPSACLHPALRYFFPWLPKLHSDAEGGPLNLPQSLVIMLAMLNFLPSSCNSNYIILHSHIISSSPPPTYMASMRRSGCLPYQHASASDLLVHVDATAALCRLCFHAKLPAKLAFVPYPWTFQVE